MLFKDNFDARDFWDRVSKGDIDAETLETLKGVAYEILHAAFYEEYATSARRADATLKAVGRFGRMDKYPGLQQTAEELSNLSTVDQAKVWAMISPHVPEDFTGEVAAKTINIAKTRPKKT